MVRPSVLLVLLLFAAPAIGHAQAPASLCEAAIAAAEVQSHIPGGFLSAIGQVETGSRASSRVRTAWPWAINAQGEGHVYANEAGAVQAARQFLASGIKSIDVGCLQVNLQYHPAAFTSLEQAFDPAANAAYAARFLVSLFHQTGSWPRAAAAYHSMTPGLGDAYATKVLAAWALPDLPDPRLPYRALGGTPASEQGESAMQKPDEDAPHMAVPESASAPPPVAARKIGVVVPSSRAAAPPPPPAGRTLAAYRAFPVRLANAPLRQNIVPLHALRRASGTIAR